ncbi:Helicase SKI2W [Dictyocoela muelleri]|nr:Helicase SKI2W [Dictyocoela muelleri]
MTNHQSNNDHKEPSTYREINLSTFKKQKENKKEIINESLAESLNESLDNLNIKTPKVIKVPKGWLPEDLSNDAKNSLNIKFEPDEFQKQAFYLLKNHKSVFIAAHTSSGKTLIADYAVSLVNKNNSNSNENINCNDKLNNNDKINYNDNNLNNNYNNNYNDIFSTGINFTNNSKVIYTSPIKALSNQKFYDFSQKFSSCGIITGDIQLNTNANCLIMTTEILRNMLYKQTDIVNNLEYVIFDEIHYINDPDRGVIWEECIMMLPKQTTLIMLSATISNTIEFCKWISRLRNEIVYIIETDKRAVPLEHFIFTNENLYNYDGKWIKEIECNKKRYYGKDSSLKNSNQRNSSNLKNSNLKNKDMHKINIFKQKGTDTLNMFSLINFLKNEKLFPSICFCFSKRKCEEYAKNLGNLNSLDHQLRIEIEKFFDESLKNYNHDNYNHDNYNHDNYKNNIDDHSFNKITDLPQIAMVKNFCLNGIGIHHSDLLPILKEIVEFLFSKGMLKILFATETFAMGVNMPAKSVVFVSLKKFSQENKGCKIDKGYKINKKDDHNLNNNKKDNHNLNNNKKDDHNLNNNKKDDHNLNNNDTNNANNNNSHDYSFNNNNNNNLNHVKRNNKLSFRFLNTSEYTQMSGRAGRRGKDTKGIVIISGYNLPSKETLEKIIFGSALPLVSQFKLNFSMILSLLIKNYKIEEIIRKSFTENRYQIIIEKEINNFYLLKRRKEMIINEIKSKNDCKLNDKSNNDKSNNDKSNNDKLNNDKSNNDKLSNDKSNNDKSNNDKLNNDKLNNDKSNNDKSNNDKSNNDKSNNDDKYFNDYFNNLITLYEEYKFILSLNQKLINKQKKSLLKDNSKFVDKDGFICEIIRNGEFIRILTKEKFKNIFEDQIENYNYKSNDFNDNYNDDKDDFSQNYKSNDNYKNNKDDFNHKYKNNAFNDKNNFNHNDKYNKINTNKILFLLSESGKINLNYNSQEVLLQEELKSRIKNLKLNKSLNQLNFESDFELIRELKDIELKIKSIENYMGDENLKMIDDYYFCLEFLKKFNYVECNHNNINNNDYSNEDINNINDFNDINNLPSNHDYSVTLKGRIASEIKTLNEILTVEMIFDNVFKDYEGITVISLFSCLLGECKNVSKVDIYDEIENIYKMRDTLIKKINKNENNYEKNNLTDNNPDKNINHNKNNHNTIYKNDKNLNDNFFDINTQLSKMNQKIKDLEDIKYGIEKIIYYQSEILAKNGFICELDFSLILPIYDWCSGESFKSIVYKYGISEGYLVRIVLRLDECCRELENILKDVDNLLLDKIVNCSKFLKRDFIFEPGLYLQNNINSQ